MVSGILLAAGESKRMGGRKLFLPFGETTVAGAALSAFLASSVAEVVVVLGHEAKRLQEHLSSCAQAVSGCSQADKPLKFAVNSRYKEGMFSSVLCGAEKASPEAQAVLISLADLPGITSDVIDTLVAAFLEAEKGIALPTYRGRRGHPLVFHRRYGDEIQALDPNMGLRGLLSLHPEEVLEVAVDCPGVVRDIDYWEDYLAQRP